MSQSKITAENLQTFQVFEGLSPEDLNRLATILKYEKYPQGTQLILQEDSDSDVFFILHGRVRVEITRVDGRATETLTTLSGGETVGELALARVGRRTASAITQMESDIFSCDASAMNSLFDSHPKIGMQVFRNLTRVLASRLADTNMMLRNATRA